MVLNYLKKEKMKQILVINTSSFVDVITNSSSELFICDTAKSIDFIKGFLETCLDTFCMGNDIIIPYGEAYGEIYKIDESNVDRFIETCFNYGYTNWNWGVEKLIGFSDFRIKCEKEHGLEMKSPWSENRAHNEKVDKEIDSLRKDYERAWKSRNTQKIKDKVMGQVVLYSAKDNSIPYSLFDLIEQTLNADRIHLG